MTKLGPEADRAWQELQQHLEWSDTTWLVFLFTRSTAVARGLEARMQEHLGKTGNRTRVLRPRTPQQLRELLPRLLESSDASVTWVEAVHLDPPIGATGPWTEAWDWFMLRTNERREKLMRALSGGLVLVAPTSLKPRFREAAPDLWSIRALVLELDVTPELEDFEPDAPTREVDALLAQGWLGEAAPLASDSVSDARVQLARSPMSRRARGRLADALEQLGRVLDAQGDSEGALDALTEGLDIRRDLATGPASRRRSQRAALARTSTILGQVLLRRGEIERAHAVTADSVAMRDTLARDSDDPESLAEYALAWSLHGDALLARGDEDAALRAFSDALEIRREVSGMSDAPRHRRYLSVGWGRMGKVLMRLGDRVGARAALQRAWDLARDLTEANPGNVAWQMEASVAGCRLGDAAFADEELEAAEQAWTDALTLRESLVAQDPSNGRWQEYLAVALGRMARLHRARSEWDLAEAKATRAVHVSQQLSEDHPANASWAQGLQRATRRLNEIREARRGSPPN